MTPMMAPMAFQLTLVPPVEDVLLDVLDVEPEEPDVPPLDGADVSAGPESSEVDPGVAEVRGKPKASVVGVNVAKIKVRRER
jgi:hypothetical protein